MKKKKIPLRKCLGCENRFPKKDLIRIVKNKDEEIFIDKTGKANGRGAYICNKLECFELAYQNKGLEKTFKSQVPKNIYNSIKKDLENEE